MDLQPDTQILYYLLKIITVRRTDIHIIIEVLRRQNHIRRPPSRTAKDIAARIAQIIALRNPHQGKLRIIIIIFCHNPMAQCLGKREGDLIPYLPIEAQKSKSVLGQSQLHGRFRKPSLRQTKAG